MILRILLYSSFPCLSLCVSAGKRIFWAGSKGSLPLNGFKGVGSNSDFFSEADLLFQPPHLLLLPPLLGRLHLPLVLALPPSVLAHIHLVLVPLYIVWAHPPLVLAPTHLALALLHAVLAHPRVVSAQPHLVVAPSTMAQHLHQY